MSIMEDIRKLGLVLDEYDEAEVNGIIERVTKDEGDEHIRNAMIEMLITEYLSAIQPEIMSALVQNKQKEVDEWRRTTERRYDEKGNRVCDETLCPSTEQVAQCVYCGKYVCKEHNYGKDERCCYACTQEQGSR
jgi:hypothetical protein